MLPSDGSMLMCPRCQVLLTESVPGCCCPVCGIMVQQTTHADDNSNDAAHSASAVANFGSDQSIDVRATATHEHPIDSFPVYSSRRQSLQQAAGKLPSIIIEHSRLKSGKTEHRDNSNSKMEFLDRPSARRQSISATSSYKTERRESLSVMNFRDMNQPRKNSLTDSGSRRGSRVYSDITGRGIHDMVSTSSTLNFRKRSIDITEGTLPNDDDEFRPSSPLSFVDVAMKLSERVARLLLPQAQLLPLMEHQQQQQQSASDGNGSAKNDKEKNSNKKAARWNASEFQRARERALQFKYWTEISNYFTSCFSSFEMLNNAFAKESETPIDENSECALDLDLINLAYDVLMSATILVHRRVLKAMVKSLLAERQSIRLEDVRAVFILLLSPLFNAGSSCVILAYLFKIVAEMPLHNQQQLGRYFGWLDPEIFKQVIHRINNFITLRLFPPNRIALPPLFRTDWWIPSAVRVLALVYAANYKKPAGGAAMQAKVPYTEFYNQTLDHVDLLAEFVGWQKHSNALDNTHFSFCQYPFVLGVQAKRIIIQKEPEYQMPAKTENSSDDSDRYLNFVVRRSHIVADSLKQVAEKPQELKKKLRVTFLGEPVDDPEATTKEWFIVLLRRLLDSERGLFSYDPVASVYWFNCASKVQQLEEFNLMGVLMGLAIYNDVNLDVSFPPCCYRKLLSPPIYPIDNPTATVGLTQVTIDDLKSLKPDLAHGIEELLLYEGDVQYDFSVYFCANYEEDGELRSANLKANGEKIVVTNYNRREFGQLYVDWALNQVIYNQFRALYYGFQGVCASNALILLRPEEAEMLICGNPELNIDSLCKVATYEGYHPNDVTIRLFWAVVNASGRDYQRRLLHFVTGSSRISVGGMKEVHFKITHTGNDTTNVLPTANVYRNQLFLPPYKTRKQMRTKLITVLQPDET